jgi:urease accessory protein
MAITTAITHTIILTITTITIVVTTTTTVIITTTTIAMLMVTPTDDEARRADGMRADEPAALYRLMTWLSPAFPVGAFSYSSGLEWAVEAGDVVDVATLQDWLAAMLGEGAGFCDAVFLAHAYRQARSADGPRLAEVAELAAAFVPSRERQLETTSQGRAFIEIARAAWGCASLERLLDGWTVPIVYPVAVGIVAAAHEIALPPVLHAFLHALTANWISAAARLVPLGQTDSQRALAALEPMVAATATRALAAALDDAGGATFRADLASVRHETQYTRLFRS